MKDLKIIHKGLSSVVIIDDKPNNYRNYPGLFVYLIRIFNETLQIKYINILTLFVF